MNYDPIITTDDVIKAGYCIVPGLKDWCKNHDVDFKTFVKKGYPASFLLSKGDALANQIINLRIARDGK